MSEGRPYGWSRVRAGARSTSPPTSSSWRRWRPGDAVRLAGVEEHPPADPVKLLAQWMEWERGETPPGRVISNMKTAGLRELLEQAVAVYTAP